MNSYKAKLHHHLFPIGMIIISGVVSAVFPSWQTIIAFFVVTGISVFISRWIITVGIINAEEDYWMYIGESIRLLKNSEPEIWAALGFKEFPTKSHLEITTKENDSDVKDNPYYTSAYGIVPLSPAKLQVFADGILTGRKTLSEGSWKGRIPGPKYRDFQDWMESKGIIARVNPEAATQGYILTESGEKWLLQYASMNTVGEVGGTGYTRKIPVRSDKEIA